ncbi:MAG TPA: hypothetical protein VHZ73_07955 [Vicinamibacterales bacterium]|jgi:hypothetical protein|nr:hypothetical protein [Vicinamibacterales bacterium]
MNDKDVAAIVRRVVVDRGLPLSLLAVSASASGWEVRLRHQNGGPPVSISIPDGRPISFRVAVQELLEEAV